MLRWVKQWDFAKDLVSGKPKAEVLQKIDEHRKKVPKNRNKNAPAQDHFERPDRKILLVHGQPGLGKTTLAHVVAQTAGYSVIEINARYIRCKIGSFLHTFIVTKEWEIQL